MHDTETEDRPVPPAVLEAIARNQKIEAIKLLREHWGLDLRSAKEAVEAYMDNRPYSPPPPGQRAPRTESGTGKLVLAVLALAALYGLYRLFT